MIEFVFEYTYQNLERHDPEAKKEERYTNASIRQQWTTRTK